MSESCAKSAAAIVLDLLQALDQLDGESSKDKEILAPALYQPHPNLSDALKKMDSFLQQTTKTLEQHKQAGKEMERLACLVFSGLQGYDCTLSHTSPTAQHDLLITGKDRWWLTLWTDLHIDTSRRGILVEAKATAGKVDDAQFARLCSIIRFDFNNTVSVGVFFTIEGASGFPDGLKRQQKIGDARLRQVIFHAKCNTPIVVFDWNDIKQLASPGALPSMLERKIADVELLTGLKQNEHTVALVDLPVHLRDMGKGASIELDWRRTVSPE